jgi:hypothetical protein
MQQAHAVSDKSYNGPADMCMLCCAVLCLRLMPKADVGDFILVADTGAYTLSMYSRYGHMVCKTCCLAAL